jgi:hypothetical protein
VSEERQVRYFIRNQQNQPLELHLSSGVLVLGPRQEAEVGPADLTLPQVKVFLKQRLVTTREAIEENKEAEEAGAYGGGAQVPRKSAKARDQQGGTK